MRRVSEWAALLAAAICGLAQATEPASAVALRTFVSGKGSDANACSLVAPCRTFAGALAQTSSGGEIVVLDSAGYGSVTITKPVTISNQAGVEGGITVSSGNGVTVNLAAEGTVTLKGLTIDGGGTGTYGVELLSTESGSLNILNCTLRGFADGIHVSYHSGGSANLLQMLVLDTLVTNNHSQGISVATTDDHSTVHFTIQRTTIQQNESGMMLNDADGSIRTYASDIDVSNNNDYGVFTTGGLLNLLVLANSTLMGNASTTPGLKVNAGVTYLANHNVIDFLLNNAFVTTDSTNTIIQADGSSMDHYSPK